jgi:hypothetical protein
MKKCLINNLQKNLLIIISIIFVISLITVMFVTNTNAASTSSDNFTTNYQIENDWGNGSVINVTITNNGPSIDGWSLTWAFPGNQKITNMWNARYSQSSSTVTVSNLNWNAVIPSNGSQTFGFTISYSGSNTSPTDFEVKTSSTQPATSVVTQEPSPTKTTFTSEPTPTSTVTTKPTSSKETFHVFLLLGQSNMAGYPKAQASDKVEDKRIIVLDYNSNQWRTAIPPLHEKWQDAIGPGDWFSKTIVEHIPEGDTIGLVPCAISGERIETFMKNGGSKYNWIIERSKLAQQRGGIINGILFHQGESNNGDSSWPGKVNTLVKDLRSDLGLAPVPFIAGELLYSGGCAGHNVYINQLPSVVENCYVVSASGLVVDPSDTQWNLHFSHDSQVTLGKRYAQKMIGALGW